MLEVAKWYLGLAACVAPAPEAEFELLCRVALLSLLGPCVQTAWFVYFPAWLLKALEFLIALGVLTELK